MKKRRNCCYLQCFCAVRSRNHCKYHGFWGSGGQKHCKLQCFFLTNVKKHWYLRCFHSHRNIKQRNLRGFWKFWSHQACRKQKNTVKTSVSAITKRRKSVRKPGPKTQKSASGPGHLRNRKKRCCKPKSWGQKVEKTQGFSTFRLPILDGRVHEQVSSVLFFTVFFWRRASRPIKNRRFWPKNAPPPPGKPVTFYECHPEDHAPAPSVRADLWIFMVINGDLFMFFSRKCI